MENNNFEQYLSVLNDEQREAVVHEGCPLLLLAGAGSGKTRVITTKIAYLINQRDVNPYSILSVTFTKKAATEMKERAIAIEPRAADAQIRTFHSFGSWFLRKYAEEAGVDKSFTVYDDEDMATLVKKAVPSLTTKEAHVAAHQISLAKDYCKFPEDDLSFIGSEFDLNDIYKKYNNRLRATGNVDFGDLILLPVKILKENKEIAAYIHNRFKVIMVDEYQDSNIAQYELLQELSGIKENSGNYVCVVGDDDQSIYHFRGAEVKNIITFPDKFPGTQIIRLERNYRSTAKILNAASLVVNKNSDRLGKTLIADRGNGGTPILAFLEDQNDEAVFCSALIEKSLNNGGKYSDWAILYRTNAQSLGFEKSFLHKKIPYVVVGSLKFYEREEIKDTLAYLSLCANKKDEISFRRVVNKPTRGLGDKTQDKIRDWAIENGLSLLEAMEKLQPELSKKAREGAEAFVKLFTTLNNFLQENSDKKLSDFIERVITDTGLDEYHKASDEIEGTQRVANLQELINSGVPYGCSIDGLLAFLDAINLDRALVLEGEEKSDDAVTLITLHNTKGLEYNKVIITGLEDGIFPRGDKNGADLEEERRLFYVGITRARDELYVTSSGKRIMYGSLQFMRPSIFLKEAGSAFKMIGRIPFNFAVAGSTSISGYSSPAHSGGNWGDKTELAEKWKKGTKIFHDDYGYGIVINRELKNSEFKIDVRFEGGGTKSFLPEYQSKSLLIIKE